MIRVCPKRDAICPHGSACPYITDRYKCKNKLTDAERREFREDAKIAPLPMVGMLGLLTEDQKRDALRDLPGLRAECERWAK